MHIFSSKNYNQQMVMFEHKVWLIYYKNESETFFMDFFFFPLLLPTDIDGDNSESKVF